MKTAVYYTSGRLPDSPPRARNIQTRNDYWSKCLKHCSNLLEKKTIWRFVFFSNSKNLDRIANILVFWFFFCRSFHSLRFKIRNAHDLTRPGPKARRISFDKFEPEISMIKGGPEIQTGGNPSGQSGAPW